MGPPACLEQIWICNGFSMQKWRALRSKNKNSTLEFLQFKRFEWLRNLMKMGVQMVLTSHQNRALGRPCSSFLRFCQVSKGCVFYGCLVRQKVGPKSKSSAILAAKLKKSDSLGRGRRERRCTGEEKEEGLYCQSSRILPESMQLRIQHAAPKVAADKG